ncbi:MAG TPA: ABC transporter substrate-binding protein [Caldimonas sp.]|jgi:putative ABC transport system substrate-binding protein|nr:ABC transporter substrate-binding protein [Caldimonas sp.]HEX2539591.1 ABC transporter substrate-binding protein [Caldimonas sp.]
MSASRRQALCIGLASLAMPSRVPAQPQRIRVGFLGGISPDASAQRTALEPFRRAMRELGHVEGQNLEMHYRWAEGQPDRLPGLAAELVRLEPDVIVTMGPGPAFAAKRATTTIPVVAAVVDTPVENGLVADFVRPGGNVTGISSLGGEVFAKRLQLLKDLVPSTRRVAVLMNPATVSRDLLDRGLADVERRLGLPIQVFEARTPDQFQGAFEAMKRAGCDGALVFADATFWAHRTRIHELLAKHRLPAILGGRDWLDGGGLASYQVDFQVIFRRAAAMVDAIVKGAKPAVTPFEQATKLELVINLKSARELGIAVPQSLLVSADELIR